MAADDDIKNLPRIQRELVQRKKQVDDEASSLMTELKTMREETPMAMLNEALSVEMRRQDNIRKQIEQARQQIRDLRSEKIDISDERASLIQQIRGFQTERAKAQTVLADKSAGANQKDAARKQIAQTNFDISQAREAAADRSKEMAEKQSLINRHVGTIEKAEMDLSQSKATSRTFSADIRMQSTAEDRLEKAQTRSESLAGRIGEQEDIAQRRRTEAAERVSPESVAAGFRRAQTVDPETAALRARAQAQKGGGTGAESKAIEQATREFHNLVGVLKDASKELANLKEGTAEFAEKQEEVSDLEKRAADQMRIITRTETDIERRSLGGGGAGGKAERVGGIAGAALDFGADTMGRFGDLASRRFVIEEERKNAELRIKGRQLQDVRSSMTDATALLSTFGGKGVTENPYDETSGIIGRDVAQTQRAIPQLQFGLQTAAGAARLGGRAIGAGIKGAAINPITGVAAGAGELVEGGAGLAIDTAMRGIQTPEVFSAVGGDRGAEAVKDAINNLGDTIGDKVGAGVQKMAGLGGQESGELAGKGIKSIQQGLTGLASASVAVAQRAGEASKELTNLTAAQETLSEIERRRERIAIAFAPQVQKFMDVEAGQMSALRSRTMSQRERSALSRQMNQMAVDPDLIARGFAPEQITETMGAASQTLGRFGGGGRALRASRQALEAESMGLGGAEQQVAGMGRLMRAGATDPSVMFERAVKQGLMSGIQDSRQFQELLSGIAEVADNTGDVDSALDNVLKGIGGGSPRDVIAATAGAKTIQDEMSGQTGGWMDTMKNAMTQTFAADVLKQSKGMGVNLDRRSLTNLQGIANLKPEELSDENKMKTLLGDDTWAVLEEMGKGKGGAMGQLGGFRRKMEIKGATAKAITATQDKETVSFVDDIISGNTEKLQSQFGSAAGRSGEQRKNLRSQFSSLYTGLKAYYNDDQARGLLARILREETGGDEKEFQAARKEIPILSGDYKQLKADEAKSQGLAAPGVMAEQLKAGQATISGQDFAAGAEVAPEVDAGKVGKEHRRLLKETADQAAAGKTVSASKVKSEKVETMDEAIKKLSDGISDLSKAVQKFDASKAASAALHVAGDVVVQGAQAIKGVLLDNAVSSVIRRAGEEVANAIKPASGTPHPTTEAPAARSNRTAPPVPGG